MSENTDKDIIFITASALIMYARLVLLSKRKKRKLEEKAEGGCWLLRVEEGNLYLFLITNLMMIKEKISQVQFTILYRN